MTAAHILATGSDVVRSLGILASSMGDGRKSISRILHGVWAVRQRVEAYPGMGTCLTGPRFAGHAPAPQRPALKRLERLATAPSANFPNP